MSKSGAPTEEPEPTNQLQSVSEHAVLEYATFRVPYEELNRIYRNNQKKMEKSAAAMSKVVAVIKSRMEGKDSVPISTVKNAYQLLMAQVEDLKKATAEATEQEIEQTQLIKKRVQYLKEQDEITPDMTIENWKKKRMRVVRYMVWYLLRCGYIETASKLIKAYDMADMVDFKVFEQCKNVEDALLKGDTTPCLEWIEMHRSKLKRMKSKLEMSVRQQDVVSLVLEERTAEALKYVRAYITPNMRPDCHEDLQTIMGIIGMSTLTPENRFQKLLTNERWEKVARMFIDEMFQLYQLSFQSAFSMALQVGIAVHKTPYCHRDSRPSKEVQCYVCDKAVWPIAEGLPNGHVTQSRILCSVTGERCDESNVPFMLPSGRVVGEKAVERLRQGEFFLNPENSTLIHVAQLERLFIM